MDVNAALSETVCAPAAESGLFAKSFVASSTSGGRKKSGRSDWCKPESNNISKGLSYRPVGPGSTRPPTCPPQPHGRRGKSEGRLARRTRAGWSPERRARQAELIRRSQPWRHSTGPRTEAGKARCAKNALRHGGRSRARILELQRIRRIFRKVDENIRAVRLVIRLRDHPRPRIEYKRRYRSRKGRFPWRETGTHAMLRKTRSGGETCVLWQR